MKKSLARAAFTALLLAGSAGAIAIPAQSALAADTPKISRDVGKPLNDAITAAQKGDFAAATTALQAADAVKDKSDYETLKINQIKAFVAVKQQDFASATTDYEAITASPAFSALDPKEQQETLRNAMLLSTNAKHWPQVIADSLQLQKMAPLDAVSEANLAIAYYNTKDMANAKAAAQRSIDLDKAANKPPQQAALQIIMSADATSNDQAGAVKALEQLAMTYGSMHDWGELIDNSLSTKGITEKDALFMYRLRFFIGAPSQADDYVSVAQIALKAGYPVEAEADLQKGLAAGTISNSGTAGTLIKRAASEAAQDRKALPQIAKAAEKAHDGKQDLALAEDYWGYGRYADAQAAGQSALTKGGADAGEAHLIIGISQVAQGQYQQAEQSLSQVDGPPARARAAQLWTLWAQFKQKPAAAPAAAQPAQK